MSCLEELWKKYADKINGHTITMPRHKFEQAVTEALLKYTRTFRTYENQTRELLCDDPREDIEFVNIFLEEG